MLNSTASFIDRIKSFVFSSSQTLVSFDVVSLFTNIPLMETIDIVTDYVYKHESRPSYPKQTFKKLLQIATGGYFLHKDKLYCQVDGVTMGSPLGPTLANFFLAHFESVFMENESDCKPELYLRYVDDIFCVFNSDSRVTLFLQFLNNLHPNLKFTSEIGPKELAFLDTSISLPDGDDSSDCSSTVYRKPTNTNVLLNFSAVCPKIWKIGLIKCFLNRAYVVCSSWSLFHKEILTLRDVFSNNGYPIDLFEKCVNQFLTKKLSSSTKNVDSVDEDSSFTLCIPYIGSQSIQFKKQLCNIFRKLKVNVRIVFKSTRVSSYFSLKDKTPLGLMANVVYKFQCSRDESITYIGKTKRHLAIRASEHFKGKSAVFDHIRFCKNCTSSASIRNFTVIQHGNSDIDIKIKEAIYIKELKPTLNANILHDGASFLLNVFR